MSFLNSLLRLTGPPQNKVAIIRICYGKLGQVLSIKVKISSGDPEFDLRAIDFVQKQPHPALHHPGKNKKRRIDQWYDIRYREWLKRYIGLAFKI